jgi:hypothetical protein
VTSFDTGPNKLFSLRFRASCVYRVSFAERRVAFERAVSLCLASAAVLVCRGPWQRGDTLAALGWDGWIVSMVEASDASDRQGALLANLALRSLAGRFLGFDHRV